MDEPFKDNLVEDFNYDYDYPDTNNGEKSLTKWHDLDIILRKILCGGVLSTMSILGIIGNIMSIIVFTRPKMNSSSDTILLGKNFGLDSVQEFLFKLDMLETMSQHDGVRITKKKRYTQNSFKIHF